MSIIISSSYKETIAQGKKIADKLKNGDIILLSGELGAGKTMFVKGIALGLGIKNEITSPTFTLMNIYEVKNPKLKIRQLVHIDTYRLENENDLIEIGVEDYLGNKNNVCVIEWPDKIIGLLVEKKTISINIEFIGENKRMLNF